VGADRAKFHGVTFEVIDVFQNSRLLLRATAH